MDNKGGLTLKGLFLAIIFGTLFVYLPISYFTSASNDYGIDLTNNVTTNYSAIYQAVINQQNTSLELSTTIFQRTASATSSSSPIGDFFFLLNVVWGAIKSVLGLVPLYATAISLPLSVLPVDSVIILVLVAAIIIGVTFALLKVAAGRDQI
jgi:hypothetical protein